MKDHRLPYAAALVTLALAAGASPASATSIPLGAAANYAVLYEGTGGHNLSITNVTIGGNLGVGGTGAVQFNGPGTISGNLDFSAANTGQFNNNNGSNVGPTSTSYNNANVTSALGTVNALSSSLGGLAGSSLALSGTQTVNESSGTLQTIGGVSYRVFNVTSYSQTDGHTLTINGDASDNPVLFNFGFSSNVNLGGLVALDGLNPDQVLFNFTSSGKNIGLNTNASSFAGSFQGVILAPNDAMSIVNARLTGRFFGGDSSDMQVVSGTSITAPSSGGGGSAGATSVPEPSSIALVGLAFAGLAAMRRRGGAAA